MVALTRSGGVQTSVLADENQTAPVFLFPDVESATAFSQWAPLNFNEMQAEGGRHESRHGRLKSLASYQAGRQVILNLGFSTGDAQGMNMIVKATDAVCRWVEKSYPGARYLLFSGMCSEKRASGFVLTRGKGKRVTAGAC